MLSSHEVRLYSGEIIMFKKKIQNAEYVLNFTVAVEMQRLDLRLSLQLL